MRIFLCRLCYNNCEGWLHPTGSKKAEKGTFAGTYRFGHEEWLSRSSWIFQGYRYSFLQPFEKIANKNKANYKGVLVILYTLEPTETGVKDKRIVGLIRNVEALLKPEAFKAVKYFQKKRWLDEMRKDMRKYAINYKLKTSKPLEILNVRFKRNDLTWFKDALTDHDRYVLKEIK